MKSNPSISLLLADVDGTPVTELFQVFRTGFQHVISLP